MSRSYRAELSIELLLERHTLSTIDSLQRVQLLRQETEIFDVRTFHTKCKIENPTDRTRSVVIPKVLVDGGSEYSWVSERSLERIGIHPEKKDVTFVLANGQEVTRSVGFAIIRLDKFFTIDEVVFAESGDLLLIGARTLDGLNLTVERARRRLVVAGPLLAAAPRRRKTKSRRRPTNLFAKHSQRSTSASDR
jgi:predicted aspartyl protease